MAPLVYECYLSRFSKEPRMKKIVLGVFAATFVSSAAYAAADAVKKCCCDDMKKMEQPAPKK